VQNFPLSCKDKFGRLVVGAAVGVTNDILDRVGALTAVDVDVITIDTAHGHSEGVLQSVKKVRKEFPYLQIIAGNVATGSGALALVEAVAAGASTIMAGSLFAGVEEAPGETIIYEGRKFKTYRGMGSIGAMKIGSKDRYFQDVEDDIKKLVPEGIEGRVPYKGHLAEIMVQYVGGLRASMGYVGAGTIPALQDAQFVKITGAGIIESHPHDVVITKESPNYSRR